MGIETGFGNVCPECEGALLKPISNTENQCPRCGHIRKDKIFNV